MATVQNTIFYRFFYGENRIFASHTIADIITIISTLSDIDPGIISEKFCEILPPELIWVIKIFLFCVINNFIAY